MLDWLVDYAACSKRVRVSLLTTMLLLSIIVVPTFGAESTVFVPNKPDMIEVRGEGRASTAATMARVDITISVSADTILERTSLLNNPVNGTFGQITPKNATLEHLIENHLSSRYRLYNPAVTTDPATWTHAPDRGDNLRLNSDAVFCELKRRLASLANFLVNLNATSHANDTSAIPAADKVSNASQPVQALEEIRITDGDLHQHSVYLHTQPPKLYMMKTYNFELKQNVDKGYQASVNVNAVVPIKYLESLSAYITTDPSASLGSTELILHTPAERAIRVAAERAALADGVRRARRALTVLGLSHLAGSLQPHYIGLGSGASRPSPRIVPSFKRMRYGSPTSAGRRRARPPPVTPSVALPVAGDELASDCIIQLSFHIPNSARITTAFNTTAATNPSIDSRSHGNEL